MQRTAGNRAVTQSLQNIGAVIVSLEADAAPPPSQYGALDDPLFNADTIAHDLLRAIDQKEHTYVMDGDGREDPTKERRNVDVPKVIAALENLTASQVAEVETRYEQFEKRSLHEDLFEGGESQRQTSLTIDQRARIAVLLKGTKGEPIPAKVLEELKRYPPAVAAQFRATLLEKSDAAGSLRQLEADTIELHELLADKLNDAKRERVMALHRRHVKEIDAIDAFYDQDYGAGKLAFDLSMRLEGLQRMRMTELRNGRWPQADALAIEDKRRSIEELNKQEEADSGLAGALASTSPVTSYMREQRKKKKEELTGDIEAIIDMNRREALADIGNANKTSGAAIAERLSKILGQQSGEAGNTLGSDLKRTLGQEHAASITAAADSEKAAGGASLVESAASELAAMEKAGMTKAVKIIEILRSFHELAKHDLLARVYDPTVSPAEKQAIGAHVESATTGLAQKYIDGFRDAYDRQRGTGRSYQQIIESASNADKTFLEDLRYGGGETSDLAELRHAMAKEDVDKVKEILRRQHDREAIDKLVAAYNGLGDGRDLRKELFGSLGGEQANVETAESAEKRNPYTGGLVTGRDAVQIAEQLAKPTAEELGGKATTGLFGMPLAPGMAEVQWITGSGEREYDVTMMHRGTTGKLREIGTDPETERLLKASRESLADLRAKWVAEKDPAKKQHLLMEIRKTRATLSGDADAYEKDNERVLGEIRGALTFAVSVALAVAIPGAGAGLAAFIETTAVNVAANVAANVVIKGGDYGLEDLKGDILGGVLGAAGGKLGDELLGRVAAKIVGPTAEATVGAAGKAGIETALAKEAATVATTGEKAAIAAEEFEAKEAGREAANVLTPEGQAAAAAGDVSGAGAGTAAKEGAERTLFEKGSREIGGFLGGLYGGKLPSGDLSLSFDEVIKALFAQAAGKAAHHQTAGAAATEEHATGGPTTSESTPSGHEPTPGETERVAPELAATPLSSGPIREPEGVVSPGETPVSDVLARPRDSPPGAPGGAAGASSASSVGGSGGPAHTAAGYDDAVKVRSEYREQEYDPARIPAFPDLPPVRYVGEARYDARRVVEGDVAFKEITIKLYLDPGPGVTKADLSAMHADVTLGVESIYNDPQLQLRDGDVLRVKIEFIDDPIEAHTIVEIQQHSPAKSAADNRAHQLRWFVGDDPIIHAHEVGHHLGLSDEYVDPHTGRNRPDAPNVRDDRGIMANFNRDSGAGPFVDPGTRMHERYLNEISEAIAEQKLRNQLAERPGFDPTPGKPDQSVIMPGDFDAMGPNGELQLTPTNVTASNLPALEQRMMMLRYQATRLGVPAEAVFDVATPNQALRLARSILGDERVQVR